MAIASEAMGRKAAKRNDVAVKLDSEAARIARNVATYRGLSLAEYLSGIVLERAALDWRRVLEAEQQALPRTPKGRSSK